MRIGLLLTMASPERRNKMSWFSPIQRTSRAGTINCARESFLGPLFRVIASYPGARVGLLAAWALHLGTRVQTNANTPGACTLVNATRSGEIYFPLSVARRFLSCSRDVTARTRQAVGSIRASGLKSRCSRRCQRFEASGCGVMRMSQGVASRNEKLRSKSPACGYSLL